MATLNDLDPLLASLNQLKPPGASKAKISSITNLCINNIQAESSIVQSLYRAFKKAPPTHKLGALYVIDSIVRQWIDLAKKNGQDLQVEGRGEPGTYPAAIKRVTELLPALFDDISKGIPEDQRPKLENVITIWERGNTFPKKLLSDFKLRLSGQGIQNGKVEENGFSNAIQLGKFKAPVQTRPTHTPVGAPAQWLWNEGLIPANAQDAAGAAPPASNGFGGTQHTQPAPPPTQAAPAPTQDVRSILASLASIAPPPPKPQVPTPQVQAAPQPHGLPSNLPPEIAALLAGQQSQHNGVQQPLQPPFVPAQQYSAPPSAGPPQQPVFQPPPTYQGFQPQPPPSIPPQYNAPVPPPQQAPQALDPLAPLRHILPANILGDQAKLMQALTLLQELQKDGVPMEQWGPVIQAFSSQHQPPAAQPQDRFNERYADANRGRDNRDRSRSPDRSGGRRRASPVYGTYEEMQSRGQQDDDRGRGGRSKYRQRSPVRSPAPGFGNDSPDPGMAMNGNPMQPKFIGLDNTLPPNNIKVLSRTLFVGGASGTQAEIETLFTRFGKVQTCIANRDKRHAFVKMTTRQYALVAKQGMEHLQAMNDREVMNIARQTKWGVGFGPRECCDYGKGESIIPINKLTDADNKWLLTAEFGGTGGKALEGGMVLEEPDIEIGAGVSSKAMSKRVVPDGGPHAGKRDSKKQRHRYGGGARDDAVAGYPQMDGSAMARPQQQMESYGYARPVNPEPVAVATPPAVPGFGFNFMPPR
ncbi:hypothetical protein K431DRAFT_296842 [Polychaeton citri CBS 116435]|uniref:Rpb7-binding protein seb1 n=1 Tax=Polychaeton citri CBS 116435 TaxID=1314669 RepID=A0A9P4UK16_9PEZI|nr:hypothetical protein K431DRAFT_296842 [Polychaeton citri CBS 116435]